MRFLYKILIKQQQPTAAQYKIKGKRPEIRFSIHLGDNRQGMVNMTWSVGVVGRV